MSFRGSMPAIITPMRNGSLDEPGLHRLIDWLIDEGSHGIVAVGTTGESPTLSPEEHKRTVEIAVTHTNGRVPVIAGTGSNSTGEAIDFTRHAEKAGADAALVVVPYYNKPIQEGLYRHFRAVAEAVKLPIFIYNVPSRTITDISVETIDRLARDCPNIIGIKDATADMTRPSQQRLVTGESFIQVSGEDATALGFNAHGGTGCISVTANVAPRLCAEFQEATLRGDYAAAIRIQDRLMPLHAALFVETSPAPVKYAASLLGLCECDVRLPLVAPSESTRERVREAMVHAGLLN